ILADIPGLIEGAHQGRGLGHDFLRHIERTRLLFHLVDMGGYEGKDPVETVRSINAELKLHSSRLAKKPMVLVATKMDLTGAKEQARVLKTRFNKTKVFPISAVTGEGVDKLLA